MWVMKEEVFDVCRRLSVFLNVYIRLEMFKKTLIEPIVMSKQKSRPAQDGFSLSLQALPNLWRFSKARGRYSVRSDLTGFTLAAVND